MAKISATKKIAIEEFPSEVRKWLQKLINPINKFFEQTYAAIAKGITIADNLKAQKFTISIVESQVYPLKVAWTLNEKPSVVFLGHIAEQQSSASVGKVVYIALTSGGAVTTAINLSPSMQWTYNNGQIEMTFLGLDSTKKYTAIVLGMV